MKKTKTSSSSKPKSAAPVELPNISHPPLKEYDIQFSLINNNHNNNNDINDNNSSNKEEFRVVADSVYYSNYQLLFTVDQQQQQEVLVYKVNASSSTVSSPSFELIHIVRQPPSKSLVSKPSSNNTINYMHVDKLKKWLFINYRSSGLHVHDITAILNNNNIINNTTTTTTTTTTSTTTTSLIASNILGTSNYYAIAIDELYKNQKIVTLNTQGLSVYEYHKPESATTTTTSSTTTTSAKIDYRTNRVQMTTKQRSVHMSLSHMSEQSLEFSYVKCVGDYIMIAQPRASMNYTLVQLDATIKAFSHSGNNNNSMLNIEDLTKSSSSETSGESSPPSSQSSSPLPPQSSQSSASVKTRRVKSSTTVQDTIIPNQWPMYGKLDNHFPKIIRLFGKAVLLRAGRNRLVTGELSGIVTTTNSQSYANNRDPITGSNYQYRASEYIFDQSLVDVALSGVWLTGVYASPSSSTHIILDAAQVVQPHHHGGDNNTESVATEQQEEQEVHHVKCQLPIVNALTGAADERLEIVAVGNGDFIVVVCGDLYYIEAKYE